MGVSLLAELTKQQGTRLGGRKGFCCRRQLHSSGREGGCIAGGGFSWFHETPTTGEGPLPLCLPPHILGRGRHTHSRRQDSERTLLAPSLSLPGTSSGLASSWALKLPRPLSGNLPAKESSDSKPLGLFPPTTAENTCWEDVEKPHRVHRRWARDVVQPLWKTGRRGLKKLHTVTLRPRIPLWSTHPGEVEAGT